MSCQKCSTTPDGVHLCGGCTQTLTVALVNIAAYHGDVLRIRPGERVKVRSAYQSTPPPVIEPAYDPISRITEQVDTMLETWCSMLTEQHTRVGTPPSGAGRQCAWLEHHLNVIVSCDWAPMILRETVRYERKLQAILDQADTGWYAGKCGNILQDGRTHDPASCMVCRSDQDCTIAPITLAVTCERGLYAVPGHGYIRCPECGTTHNAADRREQLMAEARDELAPVSVIAKVMVGLIDTEQSVAKLAGRIDQWVARKQLHDLGVRVLDGRPRRVYRIGDVFDLLNRKIPQEGEAAC